MEGAMFVYQTSTRGRSITLLNEHAQSDYRSVVRLLIELAHFQSYQLSS